VFVQQQIHKKSEKLRETARGFESAKEKIFASINSYADQLKQKNAEKEKIQAAIKVAEEEREEVVRGVLFMRGSSY